MNRKFLPLLLAMIMFAASSGYAQRTIGARKFVLDNGSGFTVTLATPPGLLGSYTWLLPPNPPPANTAFTQGGSLTGQTLRWDNLLGYYVPTSALFLAGNNIGDRVGIGTVSPNQLLEVFGVSGTPNVRMVSLSGTTGWSTNALPSDGFVMGNTSGDLLKRNPLTIFNQYGWAIGGNNAPSSTVLGTLTNDPLNIQTVGTTRISIATNGNIQLGNLSAPSTLTLEPGVGGNVLLNNIPNDNSTANFLTLDGSNRVRYRTLASILGVTANEGLVYNEPNIKLGAVDGTTNPLSVNRFINVNNNTLTFTSSNGASSLVVIKGGASAATSSVGIGTTPTTFKLEVAGNVGPSATNTYTLGSVGLRWKDGFFGPNSVYIGNGTGDQTKLSYTSGAPKTFKIDADDNGSDDATLDASGNFITNGSVRFAKELLPNGLAGTSGQYLKSAGAGNPPTWVDITNSAWGTKGNAGIDTAINFIGTTDNKELVVKTNNITRAYFRESDATPDSGAFVPGENNTYTLGTSTKRWKDLFLGPSSLRIGGFTNGTKANGQAPQTIDEATISYANGVLIIDKPLGNTGSVVPNNSDIFTLGNTNNRWKDLFLGPNSLHVGSNNYEGTISYDTISKEMRFNTNNTIGTSEVIMDNLGNLTVVGLNAGGLVKATAGTGKLTVASGGTDFEAPLTFNNGLTRTANTIKLGGALTAATTIPLGGFSLVLSGTGSFGVGTGSLFAVGSAGAITAATGITSSGTVTFSGLATGLVKATGGVLSIASASDFQTPLTFVNGLTNTSGTVRLGGTLTALTDIPLGGFSLVLSGTGSFGVGTGSLFAVGSTGAITAATGITSSGAITFSGLATGLVKSTAGVLSIATGTDYQTPLTFVNGLTNNTGTVKLGGALTAQTAIPLGGFNLLFSGTTGNIGIGDTDPAGETPNARLVVLSGNSTTSIKAIATTSTGGVAGDFSNTSSSNTNNVVTVTAAGSGDALKATANGGGYAANFTSTSTSKGVYVTTAAGKNALVVNQGSVLLSQSSVATAATQTFAAGENAVVAINDGANANFTITLNAGNNGQILYLFNGDAAKSATIGGSLHAKNTGPTNIPFGATVLCIYVTNGTGSGWITK